MTGGEGGWSSQAENQWVRTMVKRSRLVVFERLFRCSNREAVYLTNLISTATVLLYIGQPSN